MILRLTAKLGKKIGVSSPASLPADPDPLADWSARLFIANRLQYILFANTATLYSVVIPGKGITSGSILASCMKDALGKFMPVDGLGMVYAEYISPVMKDVSFAKALNMSVTASMNELVFQAKFDLIEMGLPLGDVSIRLNETPMKSINYSNPHEALRSLAMQK